MRIAVPLIVVLALLLASGSVMGQDGHFVLESVTGLWGVDSLNADTPEFTFSIRMTNNVGKVMDGINHAFRIYSDDGATWTASSGDTTGTLGKAQLDLFFVDAFSNNGSAADTLSMGGGKAFSGTGVLDGFDEVVYVITVGPIDISHHGKTLCLDSSYYPPSGNWAWQPRRTNGVEPKVFPTWDGPHCWTIIDPIAMDVKMLSGNNLPTTFSLSQNYPNPFNPTTQIAFDLPVKSQVELKVYNVLGQEVTTLVNEKLSPGSYEADWDGRSDGGAAVASGIYFYRLHTEAFTQTKKMVLLK